MAYPPAYTRTFSFTDWETLHPDEPKPGPQLDAEYDGVSNALTATQTNLALIQRADGALSNDSVGEDQLQDGIFDGIADGITADAEAAAAAAQASATAAATSASQASASAASAAVSDANAAGAAAQAGVSQGIAQNAANEADIHADTAFDHSQVAANAGNEAQGFRNEAEGFAEIAFDWAEKLEGPVMPAPPGWPEAVDDGMFSAKWWAIRAREYNSTEVIDLGTAGADIGEAFDIWDAVPGNDLGLGLTVATWGTPPHTYVLIDRTDPSDPASWQDITGGPGPAGPPNTLTVGTVTTGSPGTPVVVTITGTSPNQVLNMTIPQGDQGIQGPQGIQGIPGPAAPLADPTATIGLTAVNGVATSAMRSDAAPALSQAIAPSWTATHNFTKTGHANAAAIRLVSADPAIGFSDSNNALNEKEWEFIGNGPAFAFGLTDDAFGNFRSGLMFQRSGAAFTTITFGNATDNPAYTFAGTGAATFGGTITGSPAVFAVDVGVNTKIQSINSTSSGMVGTQSNHPLEVRTNNTIRATWGAAGGMFTAGASGGNMGAGTINATGLYVNGVAVGSGGGTPGGSTTQVQYNNAGAFAGSSKFTWDNTGGGVLTLGNPGNQTNITGVSTGDLRLMGGAGNPPGALVIIGGTGTSTAAGGLLDLRGGPVSSATAVPGGVSIKAAGSASNATGGVVTIQGGDGEGAGNNGGGVTISGGQCNGVGGVGGALTLQGGAPASDANGGIVLINGRAGVGTNRNGGAISITSGVNTGTGLAGNVTITAGAAATGTNGYLLFRTGNGVVDRLYINGNGSWGLGAAATVGTSGQVLTSQGAAPPIWTTVSGGATGANPTGTVQLTAVNGSAGTFMRSDAAPALNQSISPNWTGTHTFSGAAPQIQFFENDQGTDELYWRVRVETKIMRFETWDTALTAGHAALQIARGTGNTVASLTFGNVGDTPTYTFAGTGLTTFNGGVVLGAPTGGNKGVGTINAATNIYVNNVAVATGTIPTGANPTATIGLAAVNGSAGTFLRSDGAPALSQAIAPTWSAQHTFQQPILAANGAAATPSYSFSGDPNTGMMWGGSADTLQFVAGGVLSLNCASNYVTSQLPHLLQAGSAAAPTLAFSTDPDTGLFSGGTNALAFSTGGTERGRFLSNGFLSVPAGFQTNTGMFGITASSCAIRICDGTGGMSYGSVWCTGTNTGYHGYGIEDGALRPMFMSNNSNAGIYNMGDGIWLLQRASASTALTQYNLSAPSFTTTSARASKRETGAPTRVADILSRLRPLLYRLLAGDDREQLGLIAEEVHDVCPQLSDGKTVAYDRLAILLLAAWQEERAAA
jgi:hypothetical protein